jgi:valyl-tRNA synthetase
VNGKLANPKFVQRAPHTVVEAERAKLRQLTTELEAL